MADGAPRFINKDELWSYLLEARREIEALKGELEKVTQERDDLLTKLSKSEAVILPVNMPDLTKVDNVNQA